MKSAELNLLEPSGWRTVVTKQMNYCPVNWRIREQLGILQIATWINTFTVTLERKHLSVQQKHEEVHRASAFSVNVKADETAKGYGRKTKQQMFCALEQNIFVCFYISL